MQEYGLDKNDSPGIFAIKDHMNKVYHRNYEVFNGRNFHEISVAFVSSINRGDRIPLSAKKIDKDVESKHSEEF